MSFQARIKSLEMAWLPQFFEGTRVTITMLRVLFLTPNRVFCVHPPLLALLLSLLIHFFSLFAVFFWVAMLVYHVGVLIPQGPVILRNVTMRDNTIEGAGPVPIHCGPFCGSETCLYAEPNDAPTGKWNAKGCKCCLLWMRCSGQERVRRARAFCSARTARACLFGRTRCVKTAGLRIAFSLSLSLSLSHTHTHTVSFNDADHIFNSRCRMPRLRCNQRRNKVDDRHPSGQQQDYPMMKKHRLTCKQ